MMNILPKIKALIIRTLFVSMGVALVATSGHAETGVCAVASKNQVKALAADCGEFAFGVKRHHCNSECRTYEKISNMNVNLNDVGATTGKRVWNASAAHSFEFRFTTERSCNSKNENYNHDKCNEYFDSIKAKAANGDYDDVKPYCPDPSKSTYTVEGQAASGAIAACDALDPNVRCASLEPGMAMDGRCANYDEIPSMDPDCPGYPSGDDETINYNWAPYFACHNNYSAQRRACMARIAASGGNTTDGPTDCYCSSNTEFFRFEVSAGAWKCVPCADTYPPGWVQNRLNGTSCKSTCTIDQDYDPVTKLCQSKAICTANPNMESVGGQCLPKCASNQQRDAGLVCRDVCPRGMSLNAATNTCGCTNPDFIGTTRVPVRQTAMAGLRYPAWISGGTIAASPNPDNSLSCACPAVASPSNVSMMDFTEALSDPDARNLPIGPVSLVVGVVPGPSGVSRNTYSCGCPNFNERFRLDAADGRWKCMPTITGSGIVGNDGRVLKALPDFGDSISAANKTLVGIIDAISDSPNRPIAMVRSQVTGYDTSALYRRKVWQCADGFYRSAGNQCLLISSNPAQLAQNACSDATLIPSSNYQAGVTPAVFGTLTNRMLACCMGQKVAATDPTKFHCLGTSAASYNALGAGGFDAFYNAGAGGGVTFAGVATPNRFYLRDNSNRPVPGVYNKDGTRCTVLDALTPAQQMAALNTVRTNINTNITLNPFRAIAGVNANVNEQAQCRFVVRTALEAVCPPTGPDATGNMRTITYPSTDASYLAPGNLVPRCFQADALRVHYSIEDLTDTSTSRRAALRPVTSIGTTSEPAGSVDIGRLIRGP